jgi:hypothetical protein
MSMYFFNFFTNIQSFRLPLKQRLRFRPRDKDEDTAVAATESIAAQLEDDNDEALNAIGEDEDQSEAEEEEARDRPSQSGKIDRNRLSFAPEAGRGAPLAELALGSIKKWIYKFMNFIF